MIRRPQHLSEKGARFIARFEGLVLHPYDDAAGHATIGYGHLIHYGRVTPGDKERWAGFNEHAALHLLIADAERFATAVRTMIHPPLRSQARFDAICSAVFNLGPGVLGTGHDLGRCLNTRTRRGVGDALLEYVKADGRTLGGLVARRKAERRLFLYGRYR